jgi:cytochrome P450
LKTVSALESILLHLVRNPEVLKKAQKEIDEAIGSDRLPDFNDRERLPYVERIIWEALRHVTNGSQQM